MIVLFPEFDAPAGWTKRTDRGLVLLAPPDVDAALMMVFSLVSGITPAAWVENLLGTEQRGGFHLLSASRREITSDGGLAGVAFDVTGGFRTADALVERRAYAVFADEKVIYPFALHASIATFEQVEAPFFAAARSVRRPSI